MILHPLKSLIVQILVYYTLHTLKSFQAVAATINAYAIGKCMVLGAENTGVLLYRRVIVGVFCWVLKVHAILKFVIKLFYSYLVPADSSEFLGIRNATYLDSSHIQISKTAVFNTQQS